MRIVGGKYKGRLLRTLRGQDVRPTSDRLRETLFNVLAPRIEGTRFLDLCAGSGAVGIEALSRGSTRITLVERSRPACSVIRGNLESLGIGGDEADVVCSDAVQALKRLAQMGSQFDIVFFDPPYASGIYDTVLALIATEQLLADNGIVVVEHRAKTPPMSEFPGIEMYRQIKQGESALTFMRRKPDGGRRLSEGGQST
ncbi:MAG TPA: 16S rRNA (guanine(966)-N(2))-methyltransferase RsmD [Blastocatellia bacterium]|nr:16S rRNA (guanine(966)-N(2))-methyltransferase RsmD [Blastocatellia bacterium]